MNAKNWKISFSRNVGANTDFNLLSSMQTSDKVFKIAVDDSIK